MSAQTLNTIEQDLDALDALLADLGGDISEEEAEAAIDAWFEEMGEKRDAKLNGYARRIQMLRAYATSKREEEKRLAAQRKRNDRDADWLEGRLLRFVQDRGRQIRNKETREVETDLFRFVETLHGGKQRITYLMDPLELPEELRTDTITITVDAGHEKIWNAVQMILHGIEGAVFTAERSAKPVEDAVRSALDSDDESIHQYARLEPRGVRLAIR